MIFLTNYRIISFPKIAFFIVLIGLSLPFILRYSEGWFFASYNDLNNAGGWLGGTSSPLFSLAGFLMMYSAYKSQQEDLRLTRVEMEENRKEAKIQNETLKRQEFETTFFHILELHHQIVNSMHEQHEVPNYQGFEKDSDTKIESHQGRQYFQFAYSSLKKKYNLSIKISSSTPMSKIYKEFFEKNQIYLGHYFRNAYHILRLLDKSVLDSERKEDFSKLFAAQLSSDEQHLLFYNCFCGEHKKFAFLALKYDIFSTMDDNTLLDKSHKNMFMPKQ